MFTGNYEYTVDDRGRVAIPALWRKNTGNGVLLENVVITRGFDTCIAIYPHEQWKTSFEDNISQLDYRNEMHRHFIHMFISAAVHEKIDKQGRIILPASLRTEMNIEKETIIEGAGKFISIWSKKLFHNHIQSIREQLKDVLACVEIKI